MSDIIWFIIVVIALSIIGGMIDSVISLSIPLVMYEQTGLIEAIKKIAGKAGADWKQIVVYWVMRSILWIAAGIIIGIIAILLFIFLLIVILIIGVILYLILSMLGIGTGDIGFWVVFIPFGLIALIPLMVLMLLASVPATVFMKNHMLIFLQSWCPDVKIPLFESNYSIQNE